MIVKNVEKKEDNTLTFQVESDAAEFEAAVNAAYLKNKHSINIPGFRKGKAPRHVIEKMYGSEVFYEDAMQDCYPDALYEAAKEAGIKIVSVETLEAIEASKEGFSFKANVVVEPEMEINNYLGIEVTKKSTEVTDELVDEEIEKVRDRNSRMVTVDDRAAQNDDAVFSLFASHTIPRILITDKEGIIRAVYTDDPLATYQELAKDIDAVLIDKLSGNER